MMMFSEVSSALPSKLHLPLSLQVRDKFTPGQRGLSHDGAHPQLPRDSNCTAMGQQQPGML